MTRYGVTYGYEGKLKPTTRGKSQRHAHSYSARNIRAISRARLNTSPCVHLPPIDVLVWDDPVRTHLADGFALRCLQRLSGPDAATRPCTWRYNRLTGGRSAAVLSY